MDVETDMYVPMPLRKQYSLECGKMTKLHVYTFGDYDWMYVVIAARLRDAMKAFLDYMGRSKAIIRRIDGQRRVLSEDYAVCDDIMDYGYVLDRYPFEIGRIYH